MKEILICTALLFLVGCAPRNCYQSTYKFTLPDGSILIRENATCIISYTDTKPVANCDFADEHQEVISFDRVDITNPPNQSSCRWE